MKKQLLFIHLYQVPHFEFLCLEIFKNFNGYFEFLNKLVIYLFQLPSSGSLPRLFSSAKNIISNNKCQR